MTADKLLNLLFNAGVVVSITATVLSLGMSYRVAELLAPLRRVWLSDRRPRPPPARRV